MTPMLEQYFSIKKSVPDCILFYRLGDFYEMFFEDAEIASKELEIALTARDAGGGEKAPMCGVPYHSYEPYLDKLISNGHRVAICEQLENPKEVKGIVKRDVVRVISPGTIISKSSDEKSHNYFMTLIAEEKFFALSAIDNSTGELFATQSELLETGTELLNELSRFNPSEIVINESSYIIKDFQKYIREFSPMLTELELCSKEEQEKLLSENFSQSELCKLDKKPFARSAIALSLSYLKTKARMSASHINTINYYESKNYMDLDYRTAANLELTETLYGRSKKGSLLSILDKTATAMGARLLKSYIQRPLLDKGKIEERFDAVDFFKKETIIREEVLEMLSDIYDLERISSKVAEGLGNPRELFTLGFSMTKLPFIYDKIPKKKELSWLWTGWDDLSDLCGKIIGTLSDDPPVSTTDGGLIREGFSSELDELRDFLKHGKEKLIDLENSERKRSGIKNIKIGYNRVFGYFFEVTKSNLNLVPKHFIRRQTLANCERFFSEELKELEEKILTAGDRAKELEMKIFTDLRASIREDIFRIQRTASVIACLDVMISFSKVAFENNYNRPLLNKEGRLEIYDGRHPVVEKSLKGEEFISNNTFLGGNGKVMQLITGPNMSGKSTYMRQVALITLMAQSGSFVPCTSADIPITDRIFSRIGASDNLARGESTFMVEMKEVAQILNEATEKSLVILDEVGRGTGTYDGLSIAWAVAEYIVTDINARTLFATHYHELTELSERYGSIQNMNVKILEKEDGIIFLRKVEEGKTDRSFGIEVAKLAGVKTQVIENAKAFLSMMETHYKLSLDFDETKIQQLDFLNFKREYLLNRLENLDINELSPKAAHELLEALHNEALNLRD